MTIENTTERDPLHHLVGAMSDGTSGYIEGMEAAGQRQIVNSTKLPTDLNGGTREEFEALGFTFGEVDPRDPMFQEATLPEGWKREGSDHATYIVDERGIERKEDEEEANAAVTSRPGGSDQPAGSPPVISESDAKRLHIIAGDAAKACGHATESGKSGKSAWADPVLDAIVYAVTNHATTSTAKLTEQAAKQVRVYLDALIDGTATAEVTDSAVILDTPMGKHRFRRGENGALSLLTGVAS